MNLKTKGLKPLLVTKGKGGTIENLKRGTLENLTM